MNTNRRHALCMISMAAALFGCNSGSEKDSAPYPDASSDGTATAPEMVEYLFVQHADVVTLQDGVLTLDGIRNDVLYFSDRPHRIVGRESLEQFLAAWDEGEGSFEQTPPNAIVTIMRDDEPLDLAVTLKEPMRLDQALVYQVDVLDGPQSGSGYNAAIFIDAFGRELGKPGRLGKPGDPDPDDLDDAREKLDSADIDKDKLEKASSRVEGRSSRDGHRKVRRR